MLTKLRENTKDSMNGMIWMMTFKMKLMPPQLKINKSLTVTKKVVLTKTTPFAKQIYHKTLRAKPSNIIDMCQMAKK